MTFPTPLMLALSAAVLAIDPSIPLPSEREPSCLEDSAEHWMAVASYAEAFPKALAKKVGSLDIGAEEHFDVAIDGLGRRIVGEARNLREVLEAKAEPGAEPAIEGEPRMAKGPQLG